MAVGAESVMHRFLPNIEPYNFIEDVVEAQTAIEQAESEADAARLRIRHHNRLRITDDLTNLPSVIAVAEGLPMGPDEAESQDDYMDDANDKVLLHASEVMQEVIDNGTFYHDTDQPLRRSEVLDAIQGLHARGHAGPAVELQTALAKSDWGDDMSMGVRIESSPEDVQTLEIQYTGLENDYSEPDEYTAWRRAQQSPDQGRRGIEALKLSTNKWTAPRHQRRWHELRPPVRYGCSIVDQLTPHGYGLQRRRRRR